MDIYIHLANGNVKIMQLVQTTQTLELFMVLRVNTRYPICVLSCLTGALDKMNPESLNARDKRAEPRAN